MLRLQVGPGDLAASRFALTPLGELDHLLRKLDGPNTRTPAGAALRASRWAQRYDPLRPTLEARVLRAMRPGGDWGVDLTAPPPVGMARTPDDDLAALRSTTLEIARDQIGRALAAGGPVDEDVRAVLARQDVTAWLATALQQLWQCLVAPDWPQLLAIAERDVLHRADRLVHGGWAAALDGLHPTLRWEDGAVVVRGRPDATVRLDGRGLIFVPSVFIHPGLAIYSEPPWQPAIVYPARGSAALWEPEVTTPAALGRLVGRARADLLLRLETPASTTQLARTTATGARSRRRPLAGPARVGACDPDAFRAVRDLPSLADWRCRGGRSIGLAAGNPDLDAVGAQWVPAGPKRCASYARIEHEPSVSAWLRSSRS